MRKTTRDERTIIRTAFYRWPGMTTTIDVWYDGDENYWVCNVDGVLFQSASVVTLMRELADILGES